MLSRVQCIDQVFIIDQLNEKKIRVNNKALTEVKRLDTNSINRNPPIWNQMDHEGLRIASLNCAGLASHIIDINSDHKLKNADILLLQETSLEKTSDTTNLTIEDFPVKNFIKISNGRGVASFLKDKPSRRETVEEQNMQLEKLSFERVDIVQVYRSANGNAHTLIEKLIGILDDKKMTVILGDFNICTKAEPKNVVSAFLFSRGFQSMMFEPTQIIGRCIDQCYVSKQMDIAEIMRYSPYYSDHDGILVTL